MDIDRGRIINDFIEPNKKQYVIPVYQRNYEWSREQCVKLFDDIVNAYKKDKPHFCGSVVYAPLNSKHGIDYYVIVDGQQRLTTVYLLIKALIDSAETENEKEFLSESVFNKDKYDSYDVEEASKLKLKPIKSDNQQLYLLMENKYDKMDKSSGIWVNYTIFKEEIANVLSTDDSMNVKNIYKGIEKLLCAKIKLDSDDNAQEIFERINSTGIPLSLSDQIRNYVLMTEVNQDELYEDYWLVAEQLVSREQLSAFFMDYINFKSDGFIRENQAYDSFKQIFNDNGYTSESMLQEIKHYAEFYNVFLHGDSHYSGSINKSLEGLRLLKQSTVYLFLFRVFDDYKSGIVSETELEKVLRLLLNYSIRRIICEISSNSLRGLFKTLYNRVYTHKENKDRYYDAIVSFLMQMSSRDAIPSDSDFEYALKYNNLYRKNALCRYLLIGIENQGKEKILTDTLSIEHILPQNKNLSTSWQKMLGDNWEADRDKWLHTLGNLTLTGYNSELGDRPFLEKKKMIEENPTKATILYQDVKDKEAWDADTIDKRADRLIAEILKLYPIEEPSEIISFSDSRYKEYSCAEPGNATYKTVNYYELLGERVAVESYADMLRSVVKKLYDLDSSIIERMARNGETFTDWSVPVFSYDINRLHGATKIEGTDIYMSTGYSAHDCISYIRGLIRKYDFDIEEDFIYSARSNKPDEVDVGTDLVDEPEIHTLRRSYWSYALPLIQEANAQSEAFKNCLPTKGNGTYGSFGIGGFSIGCVANYDNARVELILLKHNPVHNKSAFDYLYRYRDEIENQLGIRLTWDRGENLKLSGLSHTNNEVGINNKNSWPEMAQFHVEWSKRILDAVLPYLNEWNEEYKRTV